MKNNSVETISKLLFQVIIYWYLELEHDNKKKKSNVQTYSNLLHHNKLYIKNFRVILSVKQTKNIIIRQINNYKK